MDMNKIFVCKNQIFIETLSKASFGYSILLILLVYPKKKPKKFKGKYRYGRHPDKGVEDKIVAK